MALPHVQMAPNDPDLRRKLAEAEKEVKRIRFEEALSLPVCVPLSVPMRHATSDASKSTCSVVTDRVTRSPHIRTAICMYAGS